MVIALMFMAHALAEDSVEELIKKLSDSDVQIRSAAAIALGNMGVAAKEAIPELTKALKDSDAEVSKLAAEAIKKIEASTSK